MDEENCPNYDTCALVSKSDLSVREVVKRNYIQDYCQGENKGWESCKRLIVKRALQFCPDFVRPDTKLSVDEIIDKFDGGDY